MGSKDTVDGRLFKADCTSSILSAAVVGGLYTHSGCYDEEIMQHLHPGQNSLSTPLRCCIVSLLALGLGTACSQRAETPSTSSGLVGVQLDAPVPSPGTWTAPDGTTVHEGQRDEDGYVLPLDIRRPRPQRADRERPSAVSIDMLRRLNADRVEPEGALTEVRLGPDDGHTENETSIDAQGATLVAGWNQFTDSGLAQGWARSSDSGLTWTSSSFGGHNVLSDPMVAAGGEGRWYFGYIASDDDETGDIEVYVRRSDDDGGTWQSEVQVTQNTVFDDKPYMAARGNEVLVAFADFGFSPAKVRAIRSLDGGLTWGGNTILANNSVGGNGANPVIAPDGTYYVFWRDSFQQFLWVSISEDQGTTWSADMSIAPMDPMASTLPPGFRIVNLPVAAAHPDGTLIVLWNDEAFGDGDILSVRSTDGGATWSAAQRVNDDASGHPQFFPWVDMDGGVAHAMWYDMRQDGSNIDVYYAASFDAGLTWSANRRITASSFAPILPWEAGAADFIGDYNGIAASGGRVYPFYQDAREGNQDVWVAVLETGDLFIDGFESGDAAAWSNSTP